MAGNEWGRRACDARGHIIHQFEGRSHRVTPGSPPPPWGDAERQAPPAVSAASFSLPTPSIGPPLNHATAGLSTPAARQAIRSGMALAGAGDIPCLAPWSYCLCSPACRDRFGGLVGSALRVDGFSIAGIVGGRRMTHSRVRHDNLRLA